MQLLAMITELDLGANMWGVRVILLVLTGAVVGWLVHLIDATPDQTFISDILLGTTGAVFANFGFVGFRSDIGNMFDGILPAVIGAIIILFATELFTGDEA